MTTLFTIPVIELSSSEMAALQSFIASARLATREIGQRTWVYQDKNTGQLSYSLFHPSNRTIIRMNLQPICQLKPPMARDPSGYVEIEWQVEVKERAS